MNLAKLCTRNVVTGTRETTIVQAAKLMRQHHVGDLVVVDLPRGGRGRKVPAGIVTDRDIVISVVAMGLDASVFTLGDLLLKKAITCREDQDLMACLHQMRSNGIRRMPVVDRKGTLIGIVTLDDVLRTLADQLGEVANLVVREQAQERKTRV
jgi:CBS domain-containing protein